MIYKILFSLAVFSTLSCGTTSDDSASNNNFTLVGDASNSTALTAQTPSSAMLKFYSFSVSRDKQCADAVTVFSETEGKEVDMNDSPTIGSGELAHGTYECVVIEMSDHIKFTPSTTEGNCVAGEEITFDICDGVNGSKTSVLPDGTTVDCTDGEDTIAMYISTSSTATTQPENPFVAPDSNKSDNGIKLSAKMVVSSAITGKFIMDTTDALSSKEDICELAPPAFSFEKVKSKGEEDAAEEE